MHYMTRLCGTVRPRPFLRLSSTTPSKTAVQKSKGVSRPSPKVGYLSLPACRGQTWIWHQFARTAPSRFTDSESTVPQPIDKNLNAIDRAPGRATPLERFFSQYPKFQFRPSESPTSEFKRLCEEYEKDARHEFNITVKKVRDRRESRYHAVPQPQIKIVRRPGGIAPLERFFVQYPKFRYDPSKPPVAQFKRLCKEYEKDVRHKFNVAIKKEFGDLYGSDEKNVNNWRKLCHVLRIDPVPDTRKKCQAVGCHLFGTFDFPA